MKRFKARLEALDFRKIFIGLIIFVIGVAAIDGSALAVQVHQNPKSGAALVQLADHEDGHHEHDRYERDEEATGRRDVRKDRSGGHHEAKHHEEEHRLINAVTSGEKITLGVSAGLLGAACAVYWVLFALWLSRAAGRSRMNRVLWLVLGLCGNLAAWAVFAVVRAQAYRRCPSCGKWQRRGQLFCADCGSRMAPRICPNCGADCEKDQAFCVHCGSQLIFPPENTNDDQGEED